MTTSTYAWRAAGVFLLVAAGAASLSAIQQPNPYIGAWTLRSADATGSVYWLEVKEQNGQLTGMFLNGGGHALPLESVKVENGELRFFRGTPPAQTEYRARIENGKLVVHTIIAPGRRGADPAQPPAAPTPRTVNWIGVKPPVWPASNANGKHTYGTPVVLFDGKTIDAFGGQNPNAPLNWSVVDGVMTNPTKPANNLVSKQKFQDFKVEAEFKVAEHTNSGIYLRGRYELQVLNDINDTTTEPFLTLRTGLEMRADLLQRHAAHQLALVGVGDRSGFFRDDDDHGIRFLREANCGAVTGPKRFA
jgi:hypothetical protein